MMELMQQLETWQGQIAAYPDAKSADLGVAKRLLKHGIEALTKLHAAQNELAVYKQQFDFVERLIGGKYTYYKERFGQGNATTKELSRIVDDVQKERNRARETIGS